jgi:hypothetical protein
MLFVHDETGSGLLSFLFRENWLARLIRLRTSTVKGLERYNGDLKAWCEEGE